MTYCISAEGLLHGLRVKAPTECGTPRVKGHSVDTLRHVERDSLDKIRCTRAFVYLNGISVRVHRKMKLKTMRSAVYIYTCEVNYVLQIPTQFLAQLPLDHPEKSKLHDFESRTPGFCVELYDLLETCSLVEWRYPNEGDILRTHDFKECLGVHSLGGREIRASIFE